MGSNIILLYRYIVLALSEKEEVSELDIDFLASKGFDREDIELLLNLLNEIGVVKISRSEKKVVLTNRTKLKKIAEQLNSSYIF